MPKASIPLLAILLTALPAIAAAQEDAERPAPKSKKHRSASEETPAPAAGKGEALAAPEAPASTPEAETTVSGQARRGRFLIRHGFFAEADLGVFLTLNGYEITPPVVASRTTSNAEPTLGLVLGYDIAHSDTINFALGLRFAFSLNSGLGRETAAELMKTPGGPDPTTKPSDYSIFESAAQAALSIHVSERVAIVLKGHVGGAILTPDPTKAAATVPQSGASPMPTPDAGGATFAPVFGGGIGVDYFTLLNDFTVGLFLRFEGILASTEMIPAISMTIPIRYTF